MVHFHIHMIMTIIMNKYALYSNIFILLQKIFLYNQVNIIMFSIVTTIFILIIISYFPITATSILKVILELVGDCNNYSHNQRFPYLSMVVIVILNIPTHMNMTVIVII